MPPRPRRLLPLLLALLPLGKMQAMPSDDATGRDLVNAAKLILKQESPAKDDPNALITALYMAGYIDGALQADRFHAVLTQPALPAIEVPQGNPRLLIQLILDHVEDSITLEKAPAKPLFDGLVAVRYGTTPEIRSYGMDRLISIGCRELGKELEKLRTTPAEKKDEAKPATGDNAPAQPAEKK